MIMITVSVLILFVAILANLVSTVLTTRARTMIRHARAAELEERARFAELERTVSTTEEQRLLYTDSTTDAAKGARKAVREWNDVHRRGPYHGYPDGETVSYPL